MILSAIISLFQAILYDLILFYVGKILTNSQQLRAFLGLKSKDNEPYNFSDTSYWVEKIGNLVMLIAIIGIVISIVTTISFILERM